MWLMLLRLVWERASTDKNERQTMKKLITAIACCLVSLGSQAQIATLQWPEVKNETKPGARWWWLGSAVDQENLRWNMEQYAAAGLGSLEISPIYGVKGNDKNNIPYLSVTWLDMLRYTQEQGRELGLDIDMINCTGWPFGGPMLKAEETAAKLVTETTNVTGDGSKQTTISINSGNGTLQRVLAYPGKGNTATYQDLTALIEGKSLKWTAPAGEWQVISVYCQHQVMAIKRPSPGSEGYALDHFDANAVASYLAWYDTKFEAGGNPWPHSFFNDSYEISAGDWTRDMFGQFEKYRGYKLESCMDKLLAKDKQTLADYRQTLSDMLLYNFTEPWTAWAHSHGVMTRNQAHGSPGNLIDLYAASDIPEIESFYLNNFGIRGLRQDSGFTMQALSSPTTLKYASSAAHVTGKPLVSSESMTWLTEHFRSSLSQMKPEVDQLFAAGVNHVMFHGTCYSPQQATWPGWKFYASVDMSPTNSIWRDAPYFFKYIERVQSFLQLGQPDNEVLVYAPFVNAMYKNTGDFANRMVQFDINKMDTKMPEMVRCVTALSQAGFDCDYISDRLLLGTTFVDGQLRTAAGVNYKALVVPVSTNMPADVKSHLDVLVSEGAQVVYGYDAAAIGSLNVAPEELRQDGLSVLRRKNENGYHYFIANLTKNDIIGDYALAVPFATAVVFDPMTGAIAEASTAENGLIHLNLKSGQSVIIATYDIPTAVGESSTISNMTAEEQHPIPLEGPWNLTFTDDSYPSMKNKAFALERIQTWEMLDEETAYLMGTGVYETTFEVSNSQLKAATAGFRLNLGDVRESARVWVNGQYVGCAWSVPYVIDLGDAVKEGTNTLRIEVTNLPANRIRKMDADGAVWRIFSDINMSNISTSTYENWDLVPSGLNSNVQLVPMAAAKQALTVSVEDMALSDNGFYYPVYELALPGVDLNTVTATTLAGEPFDGIKIQEVDGGSVRVTVTGKSAGGLIVSAWSGDNAYYTVLPAYGPFQLKQDIDFTAETEPGGGWDKMKTDKELAGFKGNGKLPWYRSKLSGKLLTELYDGLTFSSSLSNYYFYVPGYGMYTNNDFTITLQPKEGALVRLSLMEGDAADSNSSVYNSANAITYYIESMDERKALSLDLVGIKSFNVYRSLSVYEPVSDVVKVRTVSRWKEDDALYYNLHGQKTTSPRKGLYLHRGQKVIIN